MKKLGYLLIFLLVLSCRDRNNVLQEQSFYIQFNINEPAYFDLTVPTGWIYYNGSNVDLIVYRQTPEVIVAYDARSTYNIEDNCYVEVTEDGVFAEDPCSGSKWLLYDGSVSEGPASRALLEYEVEFNSSTGNCIIAN